LRIVEEVRGLNRFVPAIAIMRDSSEELAVAALRAGVSDYFRHPVPFDDLLASIERCLIGVIPRDTAGVVDPTIPSPFQAARLVGDSPTMREIKTYIGRVASTDSNVLITGETGTGKELVAASIHRSSPRRRLPFVCINCAAIPDTLLESELFGHERGAFTGAHTAREGRVQQADGGTVFFDEIGDMSLPAQAKILRAIESKEVHRVGGRGRCAVNARVIAATNLDLERKVAEGQFRPDLFYRLNVARIHLPSLRERKDDLPILLDHYLREFNRQFRREVEGFTTEAFESLLRYEWPGNVRELRNLIEAIFINLPAGRITFADLPEPFRRRIGETAGLPKDERNQVLSALFTANWNKSKAAAQLRWSRMTLYRKMAKYRLLEAGRPTPGRQSGHGAAEPPEPTSE
jgi:DNA-binding NtrC family response regulator